MWWIGGRWGRGLGHSIQRRGGGGWRWDEVEDARAHTHTHIHIRAHLPPLPRPLRRQVDAVVFSAGIGENSALVRGLICDRMQVREAKQWAGVGGGSDTWAQA